MIHFIKTNSSNPDFIALVGQLDKYLAVVDGEEHNFYKQYNGIDSLPYVLVGYYESIPVACGAIKNYATTTMEIKRMYVAKEHRGKGFASALLLELEQWSRELGATKCILETGKTMLDAIALYQKNDYTIIANYGQYIGVDNSVCMDKEL